MFASIGPFEFEASEELVKTFTDLSFSHKANFHEHKILSRKGVIEFTGHDAMTCSLKISLNTDRGNDPHNDIESLKELLESHEAVPFTVGGNVIGSGLWVIESMNVTMNIISSKGDVLSADVTLSLKEVNE